MSDVSEPIDPKSEKLLKLYEDSQRLHEEKLRTRIHDTQIEKLKIEENWANIFTSLAGDKELQLSPDQISKLKRNLHRDCEFIENDYIRRVNDEKKQNELIRELWSFYHHTRAKIDIAVQKGEQNYRNELHRQKMQTIYYWGGFLSIISGILGTVVYLIIRR